MEIYHDGRKTDLCNNCDILPGMQAATLINEGAEIVASQAVKRLLVKAWDLSDRRTRRVPLKRVLKGMKIWTDTRAPSHLGCLHLQVDHRFLRPAK